MTTVSAASTGRVSSKEPEPDAAKASDRSCLAPETGARRGTCTAAGRRGEPGAETPGELETGGGELVHPDTSLAADLTRDLQRLQAEYVNYKKRVDRDRELHHLAAVGSVIKELLPVLDGIHLARQHGDLEVGPLAAIADKLEGTLTRFGVKRFGQVGEAFNPVVHEALTHTQAQLAAGTKVTTVVAVLQPGYTMGERVIRVARVAVADPA